MGLDIVSVNWERTTEFIKRYHFQYGEVIVVVRIVDPSAEGEGEGVQGADDLGITSIETICSHRGEGQLLGIYTSPQFLQEQLCPGLTK
jgi:hypothetical protein